VEFLRFTTVRIKTLDLALSTHVVLLIVPVPTRDDRPIMGTVRERIYYREESPYFYFNYLVGWNFHPSVFVVFSPVFMIHH
jgi:hypothetical protein